MRLRRVVIFTGATACIWLLLCAAMGMISVEGALHPARLPVSAEDRQRAEAVAAESAAVLTDAEISAADGAKMRAWVVRPRVANGDVVILLHGQADNRAGMLRPAQMLLRHGFTIILPDARAHGTSEGAIATYGILEADDIRRWFEWVMQNEIPGCIDALGESMGAADLLGSLGREPGFCAVVAESTFATFREAAYDRLGQRFSTGPWLGRTLLYPAFAAGIEYARTRYGVDLRDADPARVVAGSHVPVLLIHGLLDTNLPPRHSEMIKAENPAVELWEPATADHCGARNFAPAEYEQRVIGWFESHDRR